MIFLFSNSKGIGSRLIQWGMETDASHMAILKTEGTLKPLDLILESKPSTGVDITWLKSFRKHSHVVTALAPKREIEDAYQTIANSVGGTDYDVAGIGFLSLSVIFCKKMLGGNLPKENKWSDPNDNFCSEILMSLDKELLQRNVNLSRYTEGMLTPDRAREILQDSDEFEDVTYLFEDI